MEKVDVDEKKKMFELMKDRELGGNMDWMYRGEKPDTEEFLLGKSVDKMVAEATTTEEGSGSIISERIKANVALDMQAKMREDPLFAIRKKEEDVRKRLLENPVKMKQLEKLVEQQRQQKVKTAKKAKKEKKSKKKRKKKKGKDSDSDSDSSDSEDDLVNKYLTILTQKKKPGGDADEGKHPKEHKQSDRARNDKGNGARDDRGDHHSHKFNGRNRNQAHSRHREDGNQGNSWGQRHDKNDQYPGARNQGRDRGQRPDRNEEYLDKKKANERAGRQRHDSPAQQRRKKSSSSDESEPEPPQRLQRQDSSDGEVQKKVYGLIKSVRHGMGTAEHKSSEVKVKSENSRRSRSSSSSRSRSRSPKRSSHRKEPRRHHSSPKHHRRKSPSRSRSRSPVRKRAVTPPRRRKSRSKSPARKQRSRSPPKKKLTAEEKQRRVQEMMDNAKWRDDQRRENVHRYREEDKKESSKLSSYQGEADFISSMMSSHASASSVEDRLKRNKHHIQRTRAALDKNFTER